MSSLISFKHQWVRAGILSRESLPQIWKEYQEDVHEKLLSLLEKFQVAVPIAQTGEYIIPSLLPSNPPCQISSIWEKFPISDVEYQFGRVYQFDFDFDFSKLIARIFSLHDLSKITHYWKNGFILTSSKERAFVEWKHQTYRLSIQVRVNITTYKPGELFYLRHLVEMIDAIIESFYPRNQDQVQRLIPCAHCIEMRDVLLGPFHFTYESCVSALTKNHNFFVYCRGVPSRPVNISYLAPDITFNDFILIPGRFFLSFLRIF